MMSGLHQYGSNRFDVQSHSTYINRERLDVLSSRFDNSTVETLGSVAVVTSEVR
jgi:hypothetical protein